MFDSELQSNSNASDTSMKICDEICISRHALMRLKERNGWNKRTSERMIKRVMEKGRNVYEESGYIRKWIVRKRAPKDTLFLHYGKDIYIFSNNVLVTVFHEPNRASVLKIA